MQRLQSINDHAADATVQRRRRMIAAIVSLVFLIISVILWPILVLIAPEGNRSFNAILGGFTFLIAITTAVPVWIRFLFPNRHKVHVPHAHAVVVLHNQRRVGVNRGPHEIEHKLEQQRRVTVYDLRDRHSSDRISCSTSDRKKITIRLNAIWNVTNVERYLDSAQSPGTILSTLCRAFLVYKLGQTTSNDLPSTLEKLADDVTVNAADRVRRYGIFLSAIYLTDLQLPDDPPKSPKAGEGEAERVRNLDAAVKDADPRTILHIERLVRAAVLKAAEDAKGEEAKQQKPGVPKPRYTQNRVAAGCRADADV